MTLQATPDFFRISVYLRQKILLGLGVTLLSLSPYASAETEPMPLWHVELPQGEFTKEPSHILLDAQKGAWASAHHISPGGVLVDLCLAHVVVNNNYTLTFRLNQNGLELRSENPAWQLPLHAQGPLTISAGNYHQTFLMQAASPTVLYTSLADEKGSALLDALSKNEVALLTYGPNASEAQKVNVPLLGAGDALNALRNCSSEQGFAYLGSTIENSQGPLDEAPLSPSQMGR